MRASDRAYATLVAEIQAGELAPGTVLAETEQAGRLGVSRTPMREAIGRLIADGLATQQSPRTTVVTGFDAADIQRLFEARRALEEAAARLAAQRGDRDTFAELATDFAAAYPGVIAAGPRGDDDRRTAEELTADEASIDEYYELIGRFDRELDRAVDNAYLVSALRVIRTHLARARRLARDNQDRLTQSVTEHELIARAIATGDQDLAAHATHIHLHNALRSILSALPEGHHDR